MKAKSQVRYDAQLPQAGAAAAPVLSSTAAKAAPKELLAAAASSTGRKRAVLVVHGMGQQQSFETLVSVAEGLLRHGDGGPDPKPRAVRALLGTEQLSRLELQLDSASTDEVHVYEAYWAPLTEGRVKLQDVILFLVNAAGNGIGSSFQRVFRRWVLGKEEEFPVPVRNLMQLLIALAVVVSLVGINATIGAITAGGFFTAGEWPSADLLAELSGLLHLELAMAILFILSLLLSKGQRGRFLNAVARGFFWLLVAVTIMTAAGSGALFALHGVDWLAGLKESAEPLRTYFRTLSISSGVQFITWPVLLLISGSVRRLLVQYVGDVAAYISSHKLDRFDEIRSAIRERVLCTARAIYGQRNPDGGFLYNSVAVVGHSLGSVISYDYLNRLLNDDAIHSAAGGAQQSLDVLRRTSILLTFGSPLDKIAYVFGTRDSARLTGGRSALAATSQPLILSPDFRSIPWVNVYSSNDIISGSLQLYDRPDGQNPGRVQNIEDPNASTWVWAHTEYWTNPEIWTHLRKALVPPDPKSPRTC